MVLDHVLGQVAYSFDWLLKVQGRDRVVTLRTALCQQPDENCGEHDNLDLLDSDEKKPNYYRFEIEVLMPHVRL